MVLTKDTEAESTKFDKGHLTCSGTLLFCPFQKCARISGARARAFYQVSEF